jgi:hypothetical protein
LGYVVFWRASTREDVRRSFRIIASSALTAAALAALPGAANAAPASTTFRVSGAEISFTATQGTFVGKALGNRGDRGAWKAVVEHTQLGSLPAAITGGSFRMGTVSAGWTTTDAAAGTFTGGTIDVVNPGLGCTNQTFAISGTLGSVATSTSSGGSGLFNVLLTHYRVRLFGNCVTYSATVAGIASFTY